jgi:Holliday junction DNA helicase RuvB
VLLCGSYGQGKTTLAKIIANEMGGNFIEITPSIKPRDLLRILRGLKKGDIIFIDEVHKLSTEIIETMLYPAMEDYEVHFTEGNSQRTDSRTEKIAPFTLIGATTETGKLLKPFYSKFPINITLCEYKIDTIASIIKNSFRVNGMTISDELCFAIAERSRLSPRTANAYVEGIASSAIVREADERNITGKGALGGNSAVANLNIEITKQDVDDYFNKLGVDEKGLKEEERKILRIIIEMYGGGPVGQENIAKALNVSTNRVDQEYEPYLVKLGLLVVRPQGRFATDAAYEYLGLNKSAKDDGKQD